MAAFLDEGQNTATGKNDNEPNADAATTNWLKNNRLNHLIAVFAEESITIDELLDMDNNTLNTFLDELVNDDTIKKFKGRDKLRIMSKLKVKDNKPQQKQPPKRGPIITEAELSALDSLDNKFKQLTVTTQSIESRLNEFEKEYIKQQKILNTSFDQILSNVETRRNVLLNEMKQKRDTYKQKLGKRMKSVANQRGLISQVKSKCENEINNSGVASLTDARKRANKTVELIDETLLSVGQHYNVEQIDTKIFVKFDISQSIHDTIKQWGGVKIIGNKPPVPVVNFVKVWSSRIVIEMICDQAYTGVVSRFEYQQSNNNNSFSKKTMSKQSYNNYKSSPKKQRSYKGGPKYKNQNMNRQSLSRPSKNKSNISVLYSDEQSNSNDLKEDEHDTISVVNENNMNVVFTCVKGLQQETTYKIRVRAVTNDNAQSDWSQWFSVITFAKPRYDVNRPWEFPLQKQSVNMDEWYELCNAKNTSLSLYQSQRVFHYGLFDNSAPQSNNWFSYQQQKPKQKNADTVSADWFNNLIQYKEFHSEEWQQFQQKLKKIYD